MAIRDQNLIQNVQWLNQSLENSQVNDLQWRVSNNLFWLFDNTNSITLDSESLLELQRTTNLSNLQNRVNNTLNWLNQNYISINWNNIVDTVINPANINSAQNIQNEVNTISNTNMRNIDNLPNQIQTVRNRLNDNRTKLLEIERRQTRITQIWNVTDRTIDIAQATRRLTMLNQISGLLTQRDTLTNRLLNTNNNTQNIQNQINQIDVQIWNLNSSLQGWALATVDIGSIWSEINHINQDLTIYNQELNGFRERQNLEREINWIIRTLIQQTLAIPQNVWLNITRDIINQANIATNNDTNTEIVVLDQEIQQLDNLQNSLQQLRNRYQQNLNILNQAFPIQTLYENLNNLNPGLINNRSAEIQWIVNIWRNYLWIWQNGYLPEVWTFVFNLWSNQNQQINLDAIFFPNNQPNNYSYDFCDQTWNLLNRNGNNFVATTVWWQNININGLNIQNVANVNQLDLNNLWIDNTDWLEFPLRISLNVRCRIQDPATWLNIDHHKPIILTIDRPQLILQQRQTVYTTLAWQINNRIDSEYGDNSRENLENEVIWNILREWWNQAEIDEIYNNETRRNLFIERVRRRMAWIIPIIPIANLRTWFETDMTRLDRDVPVQYLVSEARFADYLRLNMQENIREYLRWQISNVINTPPNRNNMIQELLAFQADLANNRVDNDSHIRALAAIPNDNPQWHANSWWQRLFGRRSNKNNYTKFFQWREQSIENQTLETENGNINYGIHVEVLWVNKITATINIEGKDEPEIIDAPNHNALIRWILSRTATKDGEPLNRKLRCHLAIDTLKALVMMSPQRLSRQIPVTQFQNAQWVNIDCDRIEAWVHGWNLVIRAGRVNLPNRTRENVTIFDESSFKNLHNINLLEDGITQLSTQVNSIMNASAIEYEETVNNLRNKSLRKFDTKQFLRFWPVKRLRWRMAYWKTNNDFDFTTSANAGKKSVNISLSKWEFTLSWDFEWKAYEFKSKDIGVLLRKKINRKRVFDWLELAIVERANEAYIERLRTNNLVSTESFAVADLNQDKTWRIYIYDDAWNLSYLEIEDRNLNPIANWGNAGRIPSNNIPVERVRCNEMERREFFQNPFLAWRLRRVMRRRLALF